jgi:hypothetical protein
LISYDEKLLASPQLQTLKTTLGRLSVTAYSIYWQLPSMVKQLTQDKVRFSAWSLKHRMPVSIILIKCHSWNTSHRL